jgi:hypothetical protein
MSVTDKDAVTDKPKPAVEKNGEKSEELTLVDPRELLIRKPMPYKKHIMTRSDGVRMQVLFQGLSYLEKQTVDTRARLRREEDAEKTESGEIDMPRPSLWGPELIVTAMCKPDGRRAYAENEVRPIAMQFAEQLPDGELQAAVDAVLDVSGWGKDSAVRAGKSLKRTTTTG